LEKVSKDKTQTNFVKDLIY